MVFVLYLILSTLGMTFIKMGGEDLNFVLSKSVFQFRIAFIGIIGIVFYLISFILWIIILSKYNLSFISPIASGLAYILIILSSKFLLKESISSYQYWGIVIILIGVVLMNIKK
jgi:hypothetical protein